jgi:O-antigen/teichoic acid export membrane protein
MAEHGVLLLRGSLLRTIMLAANIAVGFILMPFVVHAVGDRWYGMWVLVGTMIGYYGYFDFGLSVAVQRFIARAIGHRDDTEINRLLSTAFFLFLVLGVLAFIASASVALLAPNFLTDAEEIRVFRIVVLILGMSVAVSFAIAPVNGLFTGHMRFDVATTLQFVALIARTILIVYFMRAGYSIIALGVITFLAGLFENLGKIWYARKLFPDARVRRSLYTPGRLRELFLYGGKIFISQLAELVRFQINQPVIAAFINLSAVTMFNIAGTLAYYFRSLIQALSGVLVPMYARQQAEGDNTALAKSHLFTTKLTSVVAILGGGAMIVFGEPFIHLWMGPQYGNAYPSLVVLAIGTTVFMTQQPAMAMIYGLGVVGTLAKVSIFEAVANIVLSVILVRNYGILGVALGTAIPLLFLSLYVMYFSTRLAGIHFRSYLRSLFPLWGLLVAMQAAAGMVVGRFAPDSYLDLIILFLVLYPVQAIAALWLTFSGDEQRLIRSTTARAIGMG